MCLNRSLRCLLALALGLLLAFIGIGPGDSAETQGAGPILPKVSAPIPIEEQSFYPILVRDADQWSDVVLGQVVGDSPQATLLNFYAVMAEVGRRADRLGRFSELQEAHSAGLDRKEQIEDTSLLFHLAVRALDASVFPESVRLDMSEEAAIQLKHVLDYVFTHSLHSLSVPDAVAMKELNAKRTNPSDSWRIPGTAITLTTSLNGDPTNQEYFFSAETVSQIGEMYGEISHYPIVAQQFATPSFYKDFIHTPGYLVPPDWYLRLPRAWRHAFEVPILEQTLFQILCTVAILSAYFVLTFLLVRLFLATWRETAAQKRKADDRAQIRLVWQRFVFILPLAPLTKFAEYLIDDVVNFTGLPLVIITYSAYVIRHLSAALLVYLLLEALGRSLSLTRKRGSQSALRQQRVSSLLIPMSRAIGVLLAVLILYQLLLLLGLPSSTVLAFSAVPGLAIGLGASKLLGNLFAGLSIQTDRPLRVGEFCRVGGNLGYITKIGLRSLELQTLESRVTIPNSVADEATIINFSSRDLELQHRSMQGLDLKLPLSDSFNPFKLRQLLSQARRVLKEHSDLHETLVTIEPQPEDDSYYLVVFALVEMRGWHSYLSLREQLLVQLGQAIARAKRSEIYLRIAYGTSPDLLRKMPELMEAAVAYDPQFQFLSCRLKRIGDFSYDHVIQISSEHSAHGEFMDGLNALNRRIIEILASNGIEIPLPTQTLKLTPSDAANS